MVRPSMVIVLCAALAGACSGPEPPPPPAEPADGRVRALADAYFDGYFERNPDEATAYGVPGRRHDRLTDNSLGALGRWRAKEDAWLAEARQIDPATIESGPLPPPTRSRGGRSKGRSLRQATAIQRFCRENV